MLLLLVFNFSYGQKTELKSPLLQKTLKRDSIAVEFATLYNLINTVHPGEYMFCSKQEFDKYYDSLKNTIQSDLSVLDYYKLTAALMTKIKDGHTAVDRNNITSLLKDQLTFPYSLYKIKGEYYFSKSATADKSFTGCKILKINKIDIHTIIESIQKYMSIEGENETAINIRLSNFPFYYFIYDQSESFKIEYEEEGHQSQTVKLKGVEFEKFTKTTVDNSVPLSEEFKDNEIAILKVHSFRNGYHEIDRKVAEAQLDSFFTKLDSLKTTNLILDLRNNAGGSPDIANYLFSYLINRPYYYLDYVGVKYNSIKEWKHFAQFPDKIKEVDLSKTKFKNGLNCYTETDNVDYWFFEKQLNKINYFKGKVSVLINGGCFSTTGHLLALMRDNGIGIFYGEYSQGSNYSNSGGQAFVLPYSKTLVWIPISQFKMRTPNFQYDSKGIKPDIEIQIQPDDLKTAFDRVLEYVLTAIETKK